MTTTPPGLRKQGNMVVRGALAIMIILLIAQALGHRAASTAPTGTMTLGLLHEPSYSVIYEFYGPHGTSCEMGYVSATNAYAYCVTISPKTEYIQMNTKGVYKTCVGPNCGSNAGLNTPTLSAGIRVVEGPFTCTTVSDGVQCRLASGRGFSINATTITKLT